MFRHKLLRRMRRNRAGRSCASKRACFAVSMTPLGIGGFLSRWFGRQLAGATSSGPADVGWLIDADEAGFIYGAPERVMSRGEGDLHPKSAARCPAVLDIEARQFMIPCPYDLALRLQAGPNGAIAVVDVDGERSAVRAGVLPRIVTLVKVSEWRHPARPILQIAAPYRFVADEDVYLSQLPPFLSFSAQSRPGLMLAGRMPINIWPRILSFAFEWHDTSRPLVLRRGEPWFYVQFETKDPARQIRLVEATMTPELSTYVRGMAGVVGYVRRTVPLFKVAASRRPKRLLTPLRTNRASS